MLCEWRTSAGFRRPLWLSWDSAGGRAICNENEARTHNNRQVNTYAERTGQRYMQRCMQRDSQLVLPVSPVLRLQPACLCLHHLLFTLTRLGMRRTATTQVHVCMETVCMLDPCTDLGHHVTLCPHVPNDTHVALEYFPCASACVRTGVRTHGVQQERCMCCTLRARLARCTHPHPYHNIAT